MKPELAHRNTGKSADRIEQISDGHKRPRRPLRTAPGCGRTDKGFDMADDTHRHRLAAGGRAIG